MKAVYHISEPLFNSSKAHQTLHKPPNAKPSERFSPLPSPDLLETPDLPVRVSGSFCEVPRPSRNSRSSSLGYDECKSLSLNLPVCNRRGFTPRPFIFSGRSTLPVCAFLTNEHGRTCASMWATFTSNPGDRYTALSPKSKSPLPDKTSGGLPDALEPLEILVFQIFLPSRSCSCRQNKRR